MSDQKCLAEDKSFASSMCDSNFTSKFSLMRHEETQSSAARNCAANKNSRNEFACCKAFMRTTYDRTVHEPTHTGEKPFSCSYCDKTFNNKSSLNRHERIHTGEKPFCCSYCNKTFITTYQRTMHERTHTGEKPYSCSYCDKYLITKDVLLRHERIHTGEKPFSCKYCDKTFMTKFVLLGHERIHTGEKPFNCSYCDKAFMEKCKLVKHERLHTGEKPFSCSFCDKAFNTKWNLNRHERVHTGEETRQTCGIRKLQNSDELSILPGTSKQNCVPSLLNSHLEKKPFASCVSAETLLSLDEQVSVKPDPILESSTVNIMSTEISQVFVTDLKPFGAS